MPTKWSPAGNKRATDDLPNTNSTKKSSSTSIKQSNFGQKALLKLPQSLYPCDDVVEDFFGEGFFYFEVFIGSALFAMLEEVVETFVFFDDVFLVFRQKTS